MLTGQVEGNMKQFIKEMFSETGNISMIRVLSFICVTTAAVIAFHAISVGSDLSATSVLCGVFLGAGIGGKVAQKVSELKDGK